MCVEDGGLKKMFGPHFLSVQGRWDVYTLDSLIIVCFTTPAKFCGNCCMNCDPSILTYRVYASLIATSVDMTLSTAKFVCASLYLLLALHIITIAPFYLLRAGHIITLAREITATYSGYCTTRRTLPKTSTIQFCEDCWRDCDPFPLTYRDYDSLIATGVTMTLSTAKSQLHLPALLQIHGALLPYHQLYSRCYSNYYVSRAIKRLRSVSP